MCALITFSTRSIIVVDHCHSDVTSSFLSFFLSFAEKLRWWIAAKTNEHRVMIVFFRKKKESGKTVRKDFHNNRRKRSSWSPIKDKGQEWIFVLPVINQSFRSLWKENYTANNNNNNVKKLKEIISKIRKRKWFHNCCAPIIKSNFETQDFLFQFVSVVTWKLNFVVQKIERSQNYWKKIGMSVLSLKLKQYWIWSIKKCF